MARVRIRALLHACAGVPLALAASAAAAQQAVRIVNEGGVGDEWTLRPGARIVAPGYPSAFAGSGVAVCLAVGYRILADGTTGGFRVLRAWNSSRGTHEPVAGFWDSFGRASVEALAQWRFTPRDGIGMPRPVETVATMTFGSSRGDPAALRSHCAIRDLAAWLASAERQRQRQDALHRRDAELEYRQLEDQQSRALRDDQARHRAMGGG